jgi:hypothetical protein
MIQPMNDDAAATASTLPAPADLPTQCPETGAVLGATLDRLRNHEIRLGMSVYWVTTWPLEDGFGWSAKLGTVGGWVPGTRFDAVRDAIAELRSREQEATVAR